ncbi:acyl carrier protein [Paraburkholderia pallida]|uniref:Acyl carrier protein n=1 Tax=Paraburkholderia pallida TaxID=2547399 RepID=A0A4P7D7J1_9BURK|nr:acyl carrier protein [Paraburkholderia pallida]QBR04158.1 acyl carrier protein [Paraburkholderia pallida]
MKADLRSIISETACLDVPVASLSDTDNLYAVGLSSLGTIRVMLAIEEALGIEIPAELITFDLFQSIESLARLLASLKQDGRTECAPFAAMQRRE